MLSAIRAKIYGKAFSETDLQKIMKDISLGLYSDIELSCFLTACANGRLNSEEILFLTKAMVSVGEKIDWGSDIVVDKHCVGGLPANRTTPIVVAIVTAFGLIMPKTSSRAITSPAGTADTMEVLAPVNLSIAAVKKVVAQEGGCIVWGGGSAALSPVDDILIRVERVLDLDSEGQLVASILSKKIAAGATHVLIDMPIGPTAKVRSASMGKTISGHMQRTGAALGLHVEVIQSVGMQPIGRGIGPALEARDIVSVLKNDKNAPTDLKNHALLLAGKILEFSPMVEKGDGFRLATQILSSGQAWEKFQAICEAQGGLRSIPVAKYSATIGASKKGQVVQIDNRRLARVAKMVGAPLEKAAGVDFLAPIGTLVEKGHPLFTIWAETQAALDEAIFYCDDQPGIVVVHS